MNIKQSEINNIMSVTDTKNTSLSGPDLRHTPGERDRQINSDFEDETILLRPADRDSPHYFMTSEDIRYEV